jgi:hypothetical protein
MVWVSSFTYYRAICHRPNTAVAFRVDLIWLVLHVIFKWYGVYPLLSMIHHLGGHWWMRSTWFSIREQLLHRNVKRFQGGLVLKAHRLFEPPNSRLESIQEEELF